MQRMLLAAMGGWMLVGFVGCGGSEPAPAAASSAAAPVAGGSQAAVTSATEAAPAPVVLPVNPQSSPQEVVAAFLNAMRDGNSGVAGGLLTDQARSETTKHQWPVQPPGAPSATYKIGDPSYVDAAQTGVHIPCLWSESDGSGGTVEFEVTWALRKSPEGWRVAGFATQVVPEKPAYYFNFEDIANLKATQAEAEAAMAAAFGNGAAAEVAERPDQTQK